VARDLEEVLIAAHVRHLSKYLDAGKAFSKRKRPIHILSREELNLPMGFEQRRESFNELLRVGRARAGTYIEYEVGGEFRNAAGRSGVCLNETLHSIGPAKTPTWEGTKSVCASREGEKLIVFLLGNAAQ
jgi:hypothetical protein